MTDKMKRSEAMDNLSDVVATVMPADMGSVYLAAIALLNAEEDTPWKVVLDSKTIAAFYHPEDAHAYRDRGNRLWPAGWIPYITGPRQPVCDDEDEPTESKGCPGCGGLTEWDREDPPNPYYCDECAPWDDIPAFEGDPDDCAFKHTPRLVPVTEQIVEVDGKYYRVEP